MADRTENRRIFIYINGQEVENNMRDIRAEYSKTNAHLNMMTRGTKEYNEEAKKVRELKKHIDAHNDQLKGVSRQWQEFKKIAGAVLGASLIQGAAEKTISFFKNLVTGSAALDDAFADVMKTTGLTKREVKDLNSELGKINTRTPRARLLELARDAGKLGIQGKNNILEFVTAADKINVALGEDLGEDAIKNIGKLNDLFKLNAVHGYGAAMEKTGSALNALGAGSSAAEAYLVGFTKRMAGITTQAGFTIDEVMGLGAALDSLGQTEEVSSTALGQLIGNMFLKTDKYAQLARMSVEDFRQLLQTDANEALIKLLESVQGNNEGLSTMAAELHEVGITGARATGVVTTLANNTDIIRKQQDLSNRSFVEGTSILNEFSLKNETASAHLEKLGKWLNRVFSSSMVADWLTTVLGKFNEWIEIPLSETLEDERIKLRQVEIKLRDTNLKTADRVKLIKELQEKYPQHLGHLDAEKVKNEELFKALRVVNEEYVNRIIIQKKTEKLEDQLQKVAAQKEHVINQEDKVSKMLVASMEKHRGLNIELLKEGDLLQQVLHYTQKVQEARKQMQGKGLKKTDPAYNDVYYLERAAAQLKEYQSYLNKLEENADNITKEREDLEKRLGIKNNDATTGTDTKIEDTKIEDTNDVNENDEKPLTKKIGLIEEANKRIKEAQDEMNAATTQSDIAAAQERIKLWEVYKNALLGNQEDLTVAAIEINERVTAMVAENTAKSRKAAEDEMNAKGEQNAVQMQREQELSDIVRRLHREEFEEDYRNRIAYEEQYWNDKIELAELMGEDEEVLEREKQERISAIKREHLMKQVETLQEYWGIANQFVDMYLAGKAAKEAEHLNEIDRQRNAEMANLERLRQADKISDSVYKEDKFRAEEKYRQKEASVKRQTFERQKKADMIQAGINAALAATKTVAQTGLIGALPALAALTILTAAQIAAIQNKPVPNFGEGGNFLLKGPSHARGGMPVLDPVSGRKVAEMEGGEIIGSKGFVANNPRLAAAVVAASADGGRRVTINELMGGNWQLDYSPKRLYADGGGFSAGSGGGDRLEAKLDAVLSRPARAYVVFEDIKSAGSQMDKIEKYNRLG